MIKSLYVIYLSVSSYTYLDVDQDECDESSCTNGGICVARGNVATRECLMSGLYTCGFYIDNCHIRLTI